MGAKLCSIYASNTLNTDDTISSISGETKLEKTELLFECSWVRNSRGVIYLEDEGGGAGPF